MMDLANVHWIAVIVSAVIAFIVGWVCGGQLFPDSKLRFSSAFAGGIPSLC